MKKILSLILAITMLATFVPSAFASSGEETTTETQNLTITYDISGVIDKLNDDGKIGTSNTFDKCGEALETYLEEYSNGFFKVNSDGTTTNARFRAGRSHLRNGVELAAGSTVTLDVYVPVAGNYKMEGYYPKYNGGGIVTVYVNGEEKDSYDCTGTAVNNYTNETKNYTIDDVNLNAGWNEIKFSAGTTTSGTVRTFFLTLGNGSDYALMGVRETELNIEGKYTIKTVKSNYEPPTATVITGLTYTSANDNIAKVVDGKIVPVGHGKTTVTVSDANGRSYDIAVTVINPNMPTIKYDIDNFVTSEMDRETDMTIITEESSGGFFRYNSHTGGMIRYRGTPSNRCIDVSSGKYLVLDIFVPVAGSYTMSGLHPHFKAGGTTTVYVNEIEIGSYDSKSDSEKHPNAQDDNSYGYLEDYEFTGVQLNAGWNSFKFEASEGVGTVKTFTLTAGSGNAVMGLSEKELALGSTDTIKAYLSSTTAELTENVTYVSDNPAVAEVSENGTVTAKAKGDANITVTYSGDDVISGMKSFTTKVSVKDAKLENAVQVYIDALSGGSVRTSTDAVISTVDAGTAINAEAISDEGYVFSHWQDSNGKFVSNETEYRFSPYVNTSLIAVFDKIAVADGDTKTVYFYNGNGEYVTEKSTDGDSIEMPESASLAGYIFKMWTVDGMNSFDGTNIVNVITRAVAKYEDEGKTYDELKINNTDTVIYDKEKIFTDENATHWKRNGEIVAYGTSYTHYMWDAATIEAGTGDVEEVPVILLDGHSVENDFYMIEYDLPKGYTKLEAGILFGDDTHKTVDSCYYKAKSANKPETAKHGQFTAKPSTDTTKQWNKVRGYLIYSDGTTNRVVYAD